MLIALGHVDDKIFDMVLPNLNFALKSFRIPMYFFLSGLFFKTYAGFGDFLRRKVNNLLITLLFFHLFSFLLRIPLVWGIHKIRPDLDIPFSWTYVLPSFMGGEWKSAGALWFLLALFMVNIIFYILHQHLKRFLYLSVLLLSIAGYLLMSNKTGQILYLDVALVALPYFALGFFVRKSNLLAPSKYDKYGPIVMIPSIFFIYYFSKDINFLYRIVPDYLSLYLIPFVAILSLFWCCKNLGYVPVICYYGRYSIVILGTHQILISYIWFALLGIFGIHYLTLSITTYVTLMIAELFVIPVMITHFPRFTAQSDFFGTNWKLNNSGE